jgi:hypothetical protein
MGFSFARAKNILGTFINGCSTNNAQELSRVFPTREEAEAYEKYFKRTYKGKTYPDIVGVILDTCGVVSTKDGYKILVSTYWQENLDDQQLREAREKLEFRTSIGA